MSYINYLTTLPPFIEPIQVCIIQVKYWKMFAGGGYMYLTFLGLSCSYYEKHISVMFVTKTRWLIKRCNICFMALHEQGQCIDVRHKISEKNEYFLPVPQYSLLIIKTMDVCTDVINKHIFRYFLII